MFYHLKSILVLLILMSPSFAIADEDKSGLPQLDFNTYLLMRYLVTPNIKSILNNRETNLQNDLVKAKTSSQEAEKIKENIIKSQTELKTRSQLIIKQAISETKESIEKKEKDITQKLNEKVIKAEKKISDTQKKVIQEVIKNAEEITAKVVQNLTDLKYDNVKGKEVIKTASKNILTEK